MQLPRHLHTFHWSKVLMVVSLIHSEPPCAHPRAFRSSSSDAAVGMSILLPSLPWPSLELGPFSPGISRWIQKPSVQGLIVLRIDSSRLQKQIFKRVTDFLKNPNWNFCSYLHNCWETAEKHSQLHTTKGTFARASQANWAVPCMS